MAMLYNRCKLHENLMARTTDFVHNIIGKEQLMHKVGMHHKENFVAQIMDMLELAMRESTQLVDINEPPVQRHMLDFAPDVKELLSRITIKPNATDDEDGRNG